MTLLTAGYWHTTYWAEDFWQDDYWSDYGEVAAEFILLTLAQEPTLKIALAQKPTLKLTLTQGAA